MARFLIIGCVSPRGRRRALKLADPWSRLGRPYGWSVPHGTAQFSRNARLFRPLGGGFVLSRARQRQSPCLFRMGQTQGLSEQPGVCHQGHGTFLGESRAAERREKARFLAKAVLTAFVAGRERAGIASDRAAQEPRR